MSLTLSAIFGLFSAMLILAALPSISVLAVTSRSLSGGFSHGAAVSAGVVLGDFVFILIALLGLNLLLAMAGAWIPWLKYAAAIYLLWLARSLWLARKASGIDTSQTVIDAPRQSMTGSFLSGLLLTLGDQKAILFYLGFFPAFVDLSLLTSADVLVILLITLVAVGGTKLVYAWLVSRAGKAIGARRGSQPNRVAMVLNTLAAIILILAAVMILVRY